MNIRPATDSDQEAILAIRNDPGIVRTTTSQRAVDPAEHAAWWDRLAEKKTMLWVLHTPHGTRKIGYGRLDRLSDRTGLVIIAILPTYHGQGYGSRVLRTILFAAERHAIRLFADIRAENWRSIRLFAGHGFNPITSYHVLRGLMVRWEHLVPKTKQ